MLGRIHLLLVLIFAVNSAFGDEPCGKPADIAFVIDTSNSIWGPHFKIMVDFVQELVKKFDIGPDTTHISALTFANDVATEFYFKDVENYAEAKENVAKILQRPGSSTYTHSALKAMREDLFSEKNGARQTVPRIGILLTDGKSTYGSKTQLEANITKASGIKMIAVGIGLKVNNDELRGVVSPPAEENYFQSKNFSYLKSVKFQGLIGQQACQVIDTSSEEITKPLPSTTTTVETGPPSTTTTTTKTISTTTTPPPVNPGCQGKEADIVLVVDMSSSIYDEEFEEQLQFLSDLVRNFDIDSGKTKVGMLTFSDGARVQFYLDQYTTMKEVRKAILAVKSEGGSTNTHLALEKLQEEVLTVQHGSRPDVAHISILITDGRSSKPEMTLPRAKSIHKAGVYVFAIGVGNMTDDVELRMMASKPEYAFIVNGYDSLQHIKNILAYRTCEVPQADQPRCSKLEKADLIFGLYGISGNERQYVSEFVKGVGSPFDLQSGDVRLGLYENCGKAKFKLRHFQDGGELSYVVSDAMNTEISSLLFRIRQGFGFTKKDATRIVVLVISGEVGDMERASKIAKYLKFKATVVVVGVGKDVDTEQLKKLASYRDNLQPDISHVFPVSEPANLPYIVKKLHKLMCYDG